MPVVPGTLNALPDTTEACPEPKRVLAVRIKVVAAIASAAFSADGMQA